MWAKYDYPFCFYDLLIAVIWNDTTTWTSVKRGYNFLILRNLINWVEKKSGSAFIQYHGFKDFSSLSIVQKCMWDRPAAGKKQNKIHRMKQRQKDKKREGDEEGRRESKKEATAQADVPLLAHASMCHYSIYKPAALLDAKHTRFWLQYWTSSKFCSPYVKLHRDDVLEMQSLAAVLSTYRAFPLYIQ